MDHPEKTPKADIEQIERDHDPMGLEIAQNAGVRAAREEIARKMFEGELVAEPGQAIYTADSPNSVRVQTQGQEFSVTVPK